MTTKPRTDHAAQTITLRAVNAWLSVKSLVRDHALLALLEVQRAGLSLVKMIAAAVIIAVLVVSAWMGLVTAVVVWAVGAGASWSLAILLAAVANLVVAGGLAWYIKSAVPDLLFAATLRQLRAEDERDVEATSPDSEHAPAAAS